MPGVLAGVAAWLNAYLATEEDYKGLAQLQAAFPGRYNANSGEQVRTAEEQAAMQLYFLLTTLGYAIASGVLTGYIVRAMQTPAAKTLYDDSEAWETEDEPEFIGSSMHKAHISDSTLRHRGEASPAEASPITTPRGQSLKDRVLARKLNKQDEVRPFDTAVDLTELTEVSMGIPVDECCINMPVRAAEPVVTTMDFQMDAIEDFISEMEPEEETVEDLMAEVERTPVKKAAAEGVSPKKSDTAEKKAAKPAQAAAAKKPTEEAAAKPAAKPKPKK